jgi:hypothetical protein
MWHVLECLLEIIRKKVQGHGLVRLLGKVGSSHLIQGVM